MPTSLQAYRQVGLNESIFDFAGEFLKNAALLWSKRTFIFRAVIVSTDYPRYKHVTFLALELLLSKVHFCDFGHVGLKESVLENYAEMLNILHCLHRFSLCKEAGALKIKISVEPVECDTAFPTQRQTRLIVCSISVTTVDLFWNSTGRLSHEGKVKINAWKCFILTSFVLSYDDLTAKLQIFH